MKKAKSNKTQMEREMLERHQELSDAVDDFVIRHYGSQKKFEEACEKERIYNLENNIIDWHQLADFWIEKMSGFKAYYDAYIRENDKPELTYTFFSCIVSPYLDQLFSHGDHNGVRMLWDLIDFLMKNGSSSVQNEILVVFTEEVDLDKYSSFISSELKDYFQI